LSESRAVIFDLDGTLTRPVLDFDGIRAELGLPDGPLLESMAEMPVDERARVEEVLAGHERLAAANSELHEGTAEALAVLRRRGVRLAILTRNSRESVRTVLAKHGLDGLFSMVWTREDGAIKPSPEPVLRICERLGVPPEQSWMVGDYLFDILSGKAAGARTVLMIGDGVPPDYADQADDVIRSLGELVELLER
jgi:HAD superfamily hydrolase (TIGR01662 family)